MKRFLLCAFFFAGAVLSFGQYNYVYDTAVSVETAGQTLKLPWAGGLNSGQYGTLDLNNDGAPDLIVFDRASNKINTFLNVGSAYSYAPEYERYFPRDLEGWALFKDYNCDGRKDLFTNTLFGIKVYKNVSANGHPEWELVADPVNTSGASGPVNLQVNITDIPGIADLDNDGDLDILVYNFSTGGFIRFHKNLSVEKYGNCEALEFERVTAQWGEFEECECDIFAFNGESCAGAPGAKTAHAGGKSMTLLDYDGDGDKDLLMSQEDCSKLYFLENWGNIAEALMTDFSMAFPEGRPAHFNRFPAAFYEDVTFDGAPDLLAAPNLSEDPLHDVDFSRSSWLYRNAGSETNPEFEWVQNDFLQSEMIDEGAAAKPFFGDFDGDGDLDMFIAANGFSLEGKVYGSIAAYENTGNAENPQFTKITDDYLELSALKMVDLKPAFADMNGDGRPDLILPGKTLPPVVSRIYYLVNESESAAFSFNTGDLRELPLAWTADDNPLFTDIDGDGLTDILVGKLTGRLEYHRNTGSGNVPAFTLEREDFAGIVDFYMRRSPTPEIADVNSDGSKELLVLDNSGVIRIIENYQTAEPSEVAAGVMDPISGSPDTSRLGYYNQITAVDLYDSGYPALAVGSVQGGMYLLKNTSSSAPGASTIELKVYPNPAREDAATFISANMDANIQILTALGQPVLFTRLLQDETLRLDPSQLGHGLYIVRAYASKKNATAKKLLVAPVR